MSATAEKKQEADFTKEVDALEPELRAAAKAGRLNDALEQANALEKKARNAADLLSTSRLLLLSILLIRTTPSTTSTDWALLRETVTALSKKHGQLKQAITKMVQLAIAFLKPAGQQQQQDVDMEGADEKERQGKEDTEITKLLDEGKAIGDVGLSPEARLALVETLRTVTEGKIFVEVERARVTRMLSDMLYAKGEVDKAADTLQELAVETFGSMDRREKTEFILEQMRLNLERGDYTRMNIVSRKINTRFFSDVKQQDLKLVFYDLMIRYALHEKKHLDVCKYHREIYDTPSIKENEAKAADVLRNVVVFLILAPYDNEQSDLMARVEALDELDRVLEHKNLLKCFTTSELMRWPGIESLYGPLLRNSAAFAPDADGTARWEELHKRVVEHNIRVVSKYYTKITLARLAQLLDLPQDKAEEALADLVSGKTVNAKIDRPAATVSFGAKKQDSDRLNDWTNDLGKLLDLVERTSHVIGKELAVHHAGITVRD